MKLSEMKLSEMKLSEMKLSVYVSVCILYKFLNVYLVICKPIMAGVMYVLIIYVYMPMSP